MLRIAPQSLRQAVTRGLLLLAIALALAVLALLFAVPSARGQQPDTLQASVFPPTGAQTDAQLGTVAVDGPYTVAGAFRDDTAERDSGIAKVFDSSTGALLFVLPNPSPAAEDHFGHSVAIGGTRVVVAAPFDDAGASNAGIVYVYDLSSVTPTMPVLTLNNPSPDAGFEYFGHSVAISGSRVVVGASFGPFNAGGTVYVYNLNSLTPTSPVATLKHPSWPAVGRFGRSVAISGTRVLVSGSWIGEAPTRSETVFVYDLGRATPNVPIAALNSPNPALDDYFGGPLAISGSRVVVGAYEDDTGAPNSGTAYVYDLDTAPPVPVITLSHPTPSSFACFGRSVGISGTRVAIGARSDHTGTKGPGITFVYDVGGATPAVPALTLNNPTPGFDEFGAGLAISGARLAVSAPYDDTTGTNNGSVYSYDLDSPAPTEPVLMLDVPGPESEENFGTSVAISGTWMVVGAPGHDYGRGGAHLYDLASAAPGAPVFTLKIGNPPTGVPEQFGKSVAIFGTRVVVGAPSDRVGQNYSGQVYVYDISRATPTLPVATLPNPDPTQYHDFGGAVAISENRVVVGGRESLDAFRPPSVYVYDLTNSTPTIPMFTLNNPSALGKDYFGISVAISDSRIVVGAPRDNTGGTQRGSAHVYDLLSTTPTVPSFTINNPVSGWQFGQSVAISGTRLVVGAYQGINQTGSVYVYDLANANPTRPVVTLNNPNSAPHDAFSQSVAISGTHVAVGDRADDTQAVNAGMIYVYDLGATTPSVPVATLNNPRPEAEDLFGTSVAIDGTTVVVGTPNDNVVMVDKGSVDVFGPAERDIDGDGLLDIWEYARFGSVTAHTALDDTDGDGHKELLELAFDTDPLLPDPTAALSPVLEGGFLTITLNKRAGVSYTVESAAAPDSNAFSTATTTTITNTANTLKVRDNFNPTAAGQRFMRVKVDAAP